MMPNAGPLVFLRNKVGWEASPQAEISLGLGQIPPERGRVSPGSRSSAVRALCWQRAVPLSLGFLDVSGISILDSSNASVWPSLPSSAELTSSAVSASGLEDVCSSSGSQERGGERLAPCEAFWGGLLGSLPPVSQPV